MLGPRVAFDEPLSRYTSLRVGGPADALARVDSREELRQLLELCAGAGIEVHVLGAGFNTLVRDGGVRGVRMSFARHLAGPPDFTKVRRTADMIRPMGWHLVLYLEAEDVVENAPKLRALGVPIVIDHMARVKPAEGVAQEAFRLLLGFVRDEGFWVKVSGAERLSAIGPPFHDLVPFARALIDAAPDRVLWGTDWPHPNIEGVMPNDGDLVDLLALYAPDAEMRRRILVDNPARLCGFDA